MHGDEMPLPPVQATIVVVDDDAALRTVLYDILCEEGYHVEVAADGPTALALLRARAAPPDLILLDLMLPGMSGRQVWSALQGEPALAAIPVVGLTASPRAAAEFERSAEVICLAKPFRYHRLLGLVAQHCWQHSRPLCSPAEP
jgi:CheY-like chemotaxis protein